MRKLVGVVLGILIAPVVASAQPTESQKAALAKTARQAGKDCNEVTHVGLPEVSESTGWIVMGFVCDGYKHYALVTTEDGEVYVADQQR